MRKPKTMKIRFLRFLVKPLLVLLFLTLNFWHVNAQLTTATIIDDCICLSNQTVEGNGQFEVVIEVTSPVLGETWYIDAVAGANGIYDPGSAAPPTSPTSFVTGPSGFNLTEGPAGVYTMTGIHVDGQGFDITLTNGGEFHLLTVAPGSCNYPQPYIVGDPSVEENQISDYLVGSPVVSSTYDWFLSTGGTITTPTTETTITISWNADDAGPHTLRLTESAVNGCVVDAFMNTVIEDTIAMACNNYVNVSLNIECEGILTADMFLEDPQYENESYELIMTDENGILIPGNTISSEYIGQQILVTVVHSYSGNSCETNMTVEDRVDPVMNCVVDTIRCDESADPEVIGFPVAYIVAPTLVGPNEYYVLGPDLCGPMSLTYHDDTISNDCSHEFSSYIVRSWYATDNAGNTSYCSDTIKTTRAGLVDLDYPPNWDGLPGNFPMLEACDNWPKLANGHPDPGFTGFPTGPLCNNIMIDFTDIKIPICGENSFKVIRKWILFDMCTSEVFDTNQIIAIMDTRDPFVAAIPDVYVSTDSYECDADVTLPVPIILEECNSWTYTVGYVQAEVGSLPPAPAVPYIIDASVRDNGNGTFTLLDVPTGWTFIKYTITDACNNDTEVYFKVVVEDLLDPVAVCDHHVVVSLNNDGVGFAHAFAFDDGSWDNCGDVTFKVRRGVNKCGVPANQWLDGLEFCCADIGEDVMVELLIQDKAGNTNSCMSFVEVQDKRDPVITCPPHITVSCDFPLVDYSIFGTVVTDPALAKPIIINDPGNPFTSSGYVWGYDGVATDNCEMEVEIVNEYENINNCGTGTVTRIFKVTDQVGNFDLCQQVITIKDFDPFYINTENSNDPKDDVVWPKDYVLDGCIDDGAHPSTLPDGYGWPTIYDDECSLIAYDFEDMVFQFVDGFCYKIVRTWTVIDWCQFDQTNPFGVGYWQYNQIIMIVDDELPEFTAGCENQPIINQIDDGDCRAFIELEANAKDNCTDFEDLIFNYEVDLDRDGIVDYYGDGYSFTHSFPYGNHKVQWYVEDECGNVNTCYRLLVVEDKKKPTPICYDGIVTVPMPSTGTVEVFAKSFNICNGCESGSYDNCTPREDLRFSFSENVNEVSRIFSCDDIENGVLDTIELQMWVTDLSGNQDYCTTHLILQDNQNICPDELPELFDIAGLVMHNNDQKMEGVTVKIETDDPEFPRYSTTSANGIYAFNDFVGFQPYTLSAHSNDQPMGGVSTLDLILIQKHLLGLKNLETPFDLIAADVNSSGSVSASDLLDLRKLILGVYEEFPNNDSWRFVDASTEFSNPYNPFPFDEEKEIGILDYHSVQNNFIGVKIGDVNGSVQLNGENIDSRFMNTLYLEVEDVEFKADNEVVMNTYLKENMNINGAQFTLDYDPAKLELIDISSDKLNLNDHNFSTKYSDKGQVTFSWSMHEAFEGMKNDALLNFVFKTKADGTLSDLVTMNSSITDAEIYFEDLDQVISNKLAVEFRSRINDNSFVLYQNRPNPFSDETVVSFFLPKGQYTTLSVYDLDGKLIWEESRLQDKGQGEFLITNEEKIFSPGLYYYKLQAGEEVSTRKMIMIR